MRQIIQTDPIRKYTTIINNNNPTDNWKFATILTAHSAFLCHSTQSAALQLATQLTSFVVQSATISATSGSITSVKYSEAYFDGSNYIRLGDPMPVWSHSALSFRTCKGGEILSQSLHQHQFLTSVEPDFVRIVYLVNNTVKLEAHIPAQLLDNQWHTIEFQYQQGVLSVLLDKQATVLGG